MRIVLLNGDPGDGDGAFDDYLRLLQERLGAGGHQVSELRLRELRLKRCTGCFGCWLVKPGHCVLDDDLPQILRAFVGSDLFVFASPLKMGFVSSLLRQVNERLIPTLLPYTTLVGGECHHRPRYARYPTYALLLAPEADTDDEDLALCVELYRRQAINFHTRVGLARTTRDPVEEVADALARA